MNFQLSLMKTYHVIVLKTSPTLVKPCNGKRIVFYWPMWSGLSPVLEPTQKLFVKSIGRILIAYKKNREPNDLPKIRPLYSKYTMYCRPQYSSYERQCIFFKFSDTFDHLGICKVAYNLLGQPH